VINKLSIVSLGDRRLEANLSFLLNLVDGRIDTPSLLSEVNLKFLTRLTGSFNLFTTSTHSTNYGSNQPIDRMVRIGNKQPHLFHYI